MTAITKIWTAPVPARQDPGKPITSQWGNDTWDNLQFLLEWLGADYTGGAVQNHDHNGVNSALIEVGPNLARNGSFEEGETSWTFTDFTGGGHAINASNHQHGAQSMGFTSTVVANGGSQALSGFIPCGGDYPVPVRVWYWATVANVSSRIEIVWYDNAQSQISISTLVDNTDTPTIATYYSYGVISPTNARYYRLRLTGGVPGAGSATGTVFFDGVLLSDMVKMSSNMLTAAPPGTNYNIHGSTVEKVSTAPSWTKMKEVYVPIKGTYNIYYEAKLTDGTGNSNIRVNGIAVGTQRTLLTSYQGWSEDISVEAGDLLQIYTIQPGGSQTYVKNLYVRSTAAFDFINTVE